MLPLARPALPDRAHRRLPILEPGGGEQEIPTGAGKTPPHPRHRGSGRSTTIEPAIRSWHNWLLSRPITRQFRAAQSQVHFFTNVPNFYDRVALRDSAAEAVCRAEVVRLGGGGDGASTTYFQNQRHRCYQARTGPIRNKFQTSMAGLRLRPPMLHPEHYCYQRRVRGQSDWLSFLCKTLLFCVSSRFIPALSLAPTTG